MKQVLVGVAQSERSDEAVVAGIWLAQRLDAKIELLHAIEPPSHWQSGARSDELDRTKREVGAELAERLSALQRDGRPLEANGKPARELVHLEVGNPAKVTIDRARAIGADAIVLGAHRRRGLLDFGNVVRAVLAKSACPVWVQNGWTHDVRRILVPIDLSEHSFAALATALSLALKLHAKLTTLYAFVNPGYAYAADPSVPVIATLEHGEELRKVVREEYDQRMQRWDWQSAEHESLFVENDPVHAILAHQDGADLIVMGTHGVSGLGAAVLGSVAHGVLSSARVPVLVLPHPERAYQL